MKKGFTLIELLAVIVILAIIAVITVPKVAEMIESSRKGAAEDAFYGTIKAIELGWAKELQKNEKLSSVNCIVEENNSKKLKCSSVDSEIIFDVIISGSYPEDGIINVDGIGEANVTSDAPLIFNGYECSGNSSKAKCIRIATKEVAAKTIIKETVTTGDGLYIDPVEEGRYVFKGANPSNYLDLDGEIYRIVSVEADNTVKVVKQESIGTRGWDTGGNRVASGYCTSTYCNSWGSSTTMYDNAGNAVTNMPRKVGGELLAIPENESALNTYLNNTFYNSLSAGVKNKITTHFFNVGILAKVEGQTLETDISQESAYKWKGKVGLINATDFVKASTDSTCTNLYEGYSDPYPCKNENYLFKTVDFWTISSRSTDNTFNVWKVTSTGKVGAQDASIKNYVYPAFYLKENIIVTGKGTSGEPYEIVS